MERENYCKLDLRLESSLANDVHRTFKGFYYPDTRSLAIYEARKIGPNIKLLVIFEEQEYVKSDGHIYVMEDFEVGNTLLLGALVNQKDRHAQKTFVISGVDDSHITAVNEPDPGTLRPRVPAVKTALEELHARFAGNLTPRVIKKLGHAFDACDAAGNRKASPQELMQAFQNCGIECTQQDMDKLVRVLDVNDDGLLSYEEFMYICRGHMQDRRRQCVRQAYQKVDYNKDGIVTPEELKLFFNCQYDPQLSSSAKNEDELWSDFISSFDKDKNGFVSFREFEDYYNGVSAGIESDNAFIDMMQRTWNLDHRNVTGIPFH
jgi:Ca2+-binding EF-hand superfamily protein|uniref:EF-hand domain-containing protein n=1 Tax=Eutreptiella gymnastica TaxID=73025 RepID=A0A7S4GBD9_9EUGL|eukprot:CAMPEP_0174315252 /NCGR_PEP_ID=MMETSP0810-20121108/6172_1 /TAXON_ID=73025 ORGANISM="Eutreptiella gymnastica-like, Strain CCMP1594" /NCGR_SAMPLE_ID=MMETSP0810 /ASSEMBLY_ACC=CAM_ASM_000659 /LENGTH=319 /DNA_ID=CAMNT_0015424595 /DNA_START=29 /DNA_END=988 /DNA_ORIENTATION=-